MAAREDLQWTVINDFTPGIWSPQHGSAHPAAVNPAGGGAVRAPIGAAQLDDTYRCVCSPSGALIPAPAREYSWTQAMLGTGTRPSGQARMVVLGSHYIGPKVPVTGITVNDLINTYTVPDELYVCFGQFIDPASGSAYRYRIDAQQYKLWEATPPNTFLWFGAGGKVAVTRNGGSAFVTPWIHAYIDYCESVDVVAGGVFGTLGEKKTFLAQRIHNGENIVPPAIHAYPDIATPAADAVGTLTNPGWPFLIVGHQGRVVAVSSLVNTWYDIYGAGAAMLNANDFSYYPTRASQVGAFGVASGAPKQFLRPVEENQSGIRVIASVNANELFMVKANGGGALIKGDLDNPTVIRMPAIAPVGDTYCKPVSTPFGLFYGGDKGVYAWTGGDVSERVSPQLEGAFWIDAADTANRPGVRGQFAYIDPWVLIPNNFLYDTRFHSLWRLENPATHGPFFSYHSTIEGKFYAVNSYISASQTTIAERYNPASPADDYSWKSQPITPFPMRDINLRKVAMLVEGHGTIEITITPSYGSGSINETIAFNTNTTGQPTVIIFDVALKTESFVVRIESVGVGGDPAPTVHPDVRFGWDLVARHPINN